MGKQRNLKIAGVFSPEECVTVEFRCLLHRPYVPMSLPHVLNKFFVLFLLRFKPSSIERASVIGLRVTKSVKDYPHGTPVLISMDVTWKKQNLKLDGIYVLWICKPICVLKFSIVLSEDPIEES
ncbi:hypothetical protein L1887_29356 [Cichorium endivia]|nr:hypothetical protein L1887_29356 [Cichorium endivia]